MARSDTNKEPSGINPRGLRKWRLPTLPQRSAVPSAMLGVCSAALRCVGRGRLCRLSPSPLRSLPRPRAAGAHTAARPAPLMHFNPQTLSLNPYDHLSLMGHINKECALLTSDFYMVSLFNSVFVYTHGLSLVWSLLGPSQACIALVFYCPLGAFYLVLFTLHY